MVKITNSINNNVDFCEDEQEFLNGLYECAKKCDADIIYYCKDKPTYVFNSKYTCIEFYIEEI